jgi:hypothetical protein
VEVGPAGGGQSDQHDHLKDGERPRGHQVAGDRVIGMDLLLDPARLRDVRV